MKLILEMDLSSNEFKSSQGPGLIDGAEVSISLSDVASVFRNNPLAVGESGAIFSDEGARVGSWRIA